MPGLMVGQVIVPAQDHADFPYLVPDGIPARQREHEIVHVGGIVLSQYLFRYRVQGNERFHTGLLAVDADEPPAFRRSPDMARMELLDVGIGKPGEIGEDERSPAQFRTPVIQGHGHDPFHLLAGDIPMLGRGLLLVFDILHRIGAQDLAVHGKIQQAVQPAEAAVGLRGAEILVPDQECLVVLAEVFRYLLKGNVLLPQRYKVVRQVFLEIL